MLDKTIIPESFDFGMPAVEIIGAGSGGLDKTAMVKRAGAFDDVLADLKPKKDRTYLHVITTGAWEWYGPNLNADAFPERECLYTVPEPEAGSPKQIKLDGGLLKYHDKTYMGDGAVYQEHRTKKQGVDPSGEIIAARYNTAMHRGELIIAVDNKKWEARLQRKASGKNIYLSMGCRVEADICCLCGHRAHTANEHCMHFKKHRNQLFDCGLKSFVLNDDPHFYDISGVDVPADKIAFVLRKVAAGSTAEEASSEAASAKGIRKAAGFCKSASLLDKMAGIEKRVSAMVDDGNAAAFMNKTNGGDGDFLEAVKSYPTEEVLDRCSRKGILLSPGTFFRLVGRDCEDPADRELLEGCDDSCCGDCSSMMQELAECDCGCGMMDGAFDESFPTDLNLDRILGMFLPEMGLTNPVVGSRMIRITIHGIAPEAMRKKGSYTEEAKAGLRNAYAHYVRSFADRNDEATCMNAVRAYSQYGR